MNYFSPGSSATLYVFVSFSGAIGANLVPATASQKIIFRVR